MQNNTAEYTLEDTLLTKVMDWLKTIPKLKAIRVVDRYNKGYSDIFICINGKLVLAELKSKTGVASIHQLEFLREMCEVGAIGGICRSIRDVEVLLETAYEY
jgi:hypothetical protein